MIQSMMPPPESKHPLPKLRKLIDQWIKEGEGMTSTGPFSLAEICKCTEKQTPNPQMKSSFHLKAIEDSPLNPSEETDKITWLRRCHMTSLASPTPEEDASSDSSKESYQKVVDRLLDTDEYAERMTSEWLDGTILDTAAIRLIVDGMSGPADWVIQRT